MRKYLLLNVLLSSLVFGQGINPLKWYAVNEENRFIQQTWHEVCNRLMIQNSDNENCGVSWTQHQIELDIDNDGDMDFITQVYEDWHSGFQGVGVFENINNLDSNNVFILDTIYKQCGSHGGISAGFFNDDDFIDFYVSTANYHGPDWMEPDLDCLQQDFFYLGSSSGFVQDTLSNSLPLDDSMFVFGAVQDVFDIDNDGLDEILASGSVPNEHQTIMILSFSNEIQNFETTDIIYSEIENGGFQEWRYADLNGDGWKDLVTATPYRETDASPVFNAFYYFEGSSNGIDINNPILIASLMDPYGVLQLAGTEEAITPIDYDQNGDSELLIWWAYSFDDQHATIPIESIPQAELRLYDFQGDTLVDITDEGFFEGDNKDFNEPGNGVFIKDLNNDGIDDILFSTTWCLEKVNVSGIDPGEPETIGEEDCATFALNLGGKFYLYDVEPSGAGYEQFPPNLFSINLNNYENDPIIYLDFYDTRYDCSEGNDLSDPDWFPNDWPSQIWHYSNQVDKINFNSYVDSINADTIQTISWEGDIVSDVYRVQLSLDEFDLNLVLDTMTIDTMMVIDDLLPESEYYIRVRGENEAGVGLWSDTLTFRTIFLEFDKEKSFLPKKFSLHQNYPNPFNPVTKLRYDLPQDSFVRVTVYDMLGNIVNNLVNTNQSSGFKSIQWDATNNHSEQVSAGVYLCKIQAGDFIDTKKMILLK